VSPPTMDPPRVLRDDARNKRLDGESAVHDGRAHAVACSRDASRVLIRDKRASAIAARAARKRRWSRWKAGKRFVAFDSI
jgi:hypothetical protein